MKRTLMLGLTLALSGCSALPASTAAGPTPVIVVQTVLVTVIPTQVPTNIPPATLAASHTPNVVVVTATPLAGTVTPPLLLTAAPGDVTATLPSDPGGGLFTNLTRSGDKLSLRCQPDTLTFGVSTANTSVSVVDFYFRMQDRLSVSISTWQFGGSMESDKQGNFTIAFPASRVDPDLRSHKAWFDYQFVGVTKTGDAVGRSARIAKQVTYTIDCID